MDFPQLQDKEWLADLAFTLDIMALMNELNSKLQGKDLFAHQMYSLVNAFKGKLLLLTQQVEANNLTHLPTLLVCSLSDDQQEKYTSLLRALNGEFSRCFEDFKVLENDMLLVSSPFTVNVDNALTDLQLERIDLQSAVIGELFKRMSLMRFYASLDEQNFPKIMSHPQKMFVLFGSTYVCGQTFSNNKSRHRSSLTDSHLSAILGIATKRRMWMWFISVHVQKKYNK